MTGTMILVYLVIGIIIGVVGNIICGEKGDINDINGDAIVMVAIVWPAVVLIVLVLYLADKYRENKNNKPED